MAEEISSEHFHAYDGVGDWRVTGDGARARFRTGSFAKGVELVDAIGRIADAANHHPDISLHYGHVGVRLFTHDLPGLSDLDAVVAQQISAAARDHGVEADPSAVRNLQLTIDTTSRALVIPFWRAVLGYDAFGDEDIVDPSEELPWLHFQLMDEPRTQRGRIHLDLYVPQDEAEQRITTAVAAGGRIVNDTNAPAWWTLADPEGNEVDVAPWPDTH